MNVSYVIILAILLIILYVVNSNDQSKEHFDITNEAAQGIASIYNSNKFSVTNANITDTLTTKTLNATSVTADSQVVKTSNVSGVFTADSIITPNTVTANNITASGNITAGGNVTTNNAVINGNTTVTGQLIKKSPVYRKHDPAGYFGIYAYGFTIPLYYGWNMMWGDHNRSMNLRKKTSLPVSYANTDMRNAGDGDQNWTPRFLTVFPGYIARFYYWDVPSTNNDIYNSGEYDWTGGSPGNNKRVHLINISLLEEGPNSNTSSASSLTG